MTEITAKTPWAGHTGDVPLHLDYFDGSMFEALELVAKEGTQGTSRSTSWASPTTYPQMIEEIKKCARSLKTIGVRAGDKVTIAMPNCPQAIYMFYAVNLVGGIANMIHPLSAEKEIEFILTSLRASPPSRSTSSTTSSRASARTQRSSTSSSRASRMS